MTDTKTRIYEVTVQGTQTPRLVRAGTQAQAIKHVADPMFTATPVSVERGMELAQKGIKVEIAGAE